MLPAYLPTCLKPAYTCLPTYLPMCLLAYLGVGGGLGAGDACGKWNDTNEDNARRKCGLKWGVRNGAYRMLYDGRHELYRKACMRQNPERPRQEEKHTHQEDKSLGLLREYGTNCGSTMRKAKKEVVR